MWSTSKSQGLYLSLDESWGSAQLSSAQLSSAQLSSAQVRSRAACQALPQLRCRQGHGLHGRWIAFTRFLDDGGICLSNTAAERGVRGVALGRKSWLFYGSDHGGERAALMYSLIVTAKMNDIDPQAWLADVLARVAEHPVHKLDELLPLNWRRTPAQSSQAA